MFVNREYVSRQTVPRKTDDDEPTQATIVQNEILFAEQITICYDLFRNLFHLYFFYRASYHDLSRVLTSMIESLSITGDRRSLQRIILADLNCPVDLNSISPQNLFDFMFLGTKDGQDMPTLIKVKGILGKDTGSRKFSKPGVTGILEEVVPQLEKLKKFAHEVGKNVKVPGLAIFKTPLYAISSSETVTQYKHRQETAFKHLFFKFKGYDPIKAHCPKDRFDATLPKQYQALSAEISAHLLNLRGGNLNSLLEYVRQNFNPRLVPEGVKLFSESLMPLDGLVDNLGPNGLYGDAQECRLASKMEWELNEKYRNLSASIKDALQRESGREKMREMSNRKGITRRIVN